jgi:hypothetical protein
MIAISGGLNIHPGLTTATANGGLLKSIWNFLIGLFENYWIVGVKFALGALN